MKETRTKVLLGVLAVLLLLVAWHYLGPEGGDEVSGANGNPPGIAGAIPRSTGEGNKKPPVEFVETLRVADLAGQAHSFTPGRDPWHFVDPPPPPPPPPPKPPSAEELERMRQAQERLARERAEALARQQAIDAQPKPQPFTMNYLGNFGSPQKRLAVFTDGKTIYNALEGEVLEGKFIVAHIGYESVDIQFVGFPDWPAQRLAVGRPSR
jgi:hypothetical protein